jgi:hypothetical protein
MIEVSVDSKPTDRVRVPLTREGEAFWRSAAATSILQSLKGSVCNSQAEVIVAVTSASSETTHDARAVLRLSLVVSIVLDTGAKSAEEGIAEEVVVEGTARCMTSLFGLANRFLPLNVNGSSAPLYSPRSSANSELFVFIDDSNATEVSTSPCGANVCTSTAAENSADIPPDPAAAPIDGSEDANTSMRDLIIVLAVAAVAVLIVLVVVVAKRQRQAMSLRRRAERHHNGVSFSDAIAAEMPLLDLPVSEAACIVNARNEPQWKRDAYREPVVPDEDVVSLGNSSHNSLDSIPVEGSFISPSLSQRRRNATAAPAH